MTRYPNVLHESRSTSMNRKMKQALSLNLGSALCLIVMLYLVEYLFIKSNTLPFSISSLLSSTNHFSFAWHLLTVAILPIYLALLIFGASIFGISLGSSLQRWLSKRANI